MGGHAFGWSRVWVGEKAFISRMCSHTLRGRCIRSERSPKARVLAAHKHIHARALWLTAPHAGQSRWWPSRPLLVVPALLQLRSRIYDLSSPPVTHTQEPGVPP